MDSTYSSEKAKLLKMQANYLRYLASVYPLPNSQCNSVGSSPVHSVSPQRSSRDANPHDEVPVKRVQKKFEELLEEQLQRNPSLNLIEEIPNVNSPNPRYLKRGEGHLCTYTRSQSSSQLKTLRNRLSQHESPEKVIDLGKIHRIKEELIQKNYDLKKEEKEIISIRKIESEDLKQIRKERFRERKSSPQREEVEQLKKIILKMQNDEKIKELKHQEEVRKLNIEVLRLRQKVAGLERKNQPIRICTGFSSSTKINQMNITPMKRNGEYQGKIQKFVEKNKLNSARKVRKENFLFDQFEYLSFDSRE